MAEVRPQDLALLSPEVKQTLCMFGEWLDGRLLSWNDFVWSYTNLRRNFTHTWAKWFKASGVDIIPHRDWKLGKDGSIFKPILALEGRRLRELEAYSGLGHYVRVSMALTEGSLDIALRPSNLFDSRQQVFMVRPGQAIDDPVSVLNTPALTSKEQEQLGTIPMVETPHRIVSALYLLG